MKNLTIRLGIDNKPMGNIDIVDTGKDIRITPIETVMRDHTHDSINKKILSLK